MLPLNYTTGPGARLMNAEDITNRIMKEMSAKPYEVRQIVFKAVDSIISGLSPAPQWPTESNIKHQGSNPPPQTTKPDFNPPGQDAPPDLPCGSGGPTVEPSLQTWQREDPEWCVGMLRQLAEDLMPDAECDAAPRKLDKYRGGQLMQRRLNVLAAANALEAYVTGGKQVEQSESKAGNADQLLSEASGSVPSAAQE